MTANDYDLIVLDWNLPDRSGIDLCQHLRASGCSIPILFLTARTTKADLVAALDSGADDFVSKPFDTQELLARARALMRRPEALVPQTLQVGRFVLNHDTLQIQIEEHQVQLTLKEYSLLEFLMRSPNKPFSAEAILHRLWPSETNSSPEVLRTHVKTLRKKTRRH